MDLYIVQSIDYVGGSLYSLVLPRNPACDGSLNNFTYIEIQEMGLSIIPLRKLGDEFLVPPEVSAKDIIYF